MRVSLLCLWPHRSGGGGGPGPPTLVPVRLTGSWIFDLIPAEAETQTGKGLLVVPGYFVV